MKLSLIIEAIAKGRGIDQTRRAMGGLDRESRKAASGIGQADRAMTRAERSAERLGRAGYRIGYGIGRGTRMAIGGLFALERRLTLTNAQAMKLGRWTGRQLGGGIRYGALAAAGGVAAAGWKVLSAGVTFENIGAQLEVAEGSSAKAKKAMAWITKFAAETPYELEEVASAFAYARNFGIDPMTGSMRIMGDASAAMRKTFTDAIDAIGDAQMLQFERLPEFGIKANQSGGSVAFSYVTKAGKQAVKTVKKDALTIQRALLDILDEKYAGQMARRARTTEGKWSNLMDQITIQANRVWEGGAGSAANHVLDGWIARMDQMEKDGSLKRWADETGAGIGELVGELGKADWAGIATDIRDTGSAFRDLASGVRSLSAAGTGLTNLSNRLQGIGSIAGLVLRGELIATPGGIKGLKDMAGSGTVRAAPAPARPAPPRPSRPYQGPFLNAPPAWLKGAQRTTNAKLSVRITTDKGVTAKPTGISADRGLDIEVDTGRAMTGVA